MGIGDIVNLFVPPGQRTPQPTNPFSRPNTLLAPSLYPGANVTTPQVSVPMTPEQYYGGGGSPAGQYGTPGMVIPGEEIPENWPLAVPGFAFLRQPDGSVWRRPNILPDSMLPPALQRSNPFLRKLVYRPNKWDMRILREAAAFQWIAEHGGLKSCCRIPELGAPIWEQPPWQVMPSQGVEYRHMFSILASALLPFNGTDTLVDQFRVPIGYDGVLNTVVAGFTGNGFVDGSGAIVWRVRVGARFAKDLGNITNTYGSFQNALLVPGVNIRLISGQTVSVFASVPAGSPITTGATDRITAGLFGWTYPHR